MVKHYTSLAGKGVEILFGQRQGEPAARPSRSRSSSFMGVPASALPRVEADVEEALAAEWASWQKGQTTSEPAESSPGDQPDASLAEVETGSTPTPVARTRAEERLAAWRAWQQAKESYSPAPQRSGVEAASVLRSMGGAQPQEATAPGLASAASSYAAADAEMAEETMPSPMYVDAEVDAEGSLAEASASETAPASPDTSARTESTGPSDSMPATGASDGQLEPEGPQTPGMILDGPETPEEDQPSRVPADDEVVGYVGSEQRQALWNEIMELYEIVPNLLCTDENLASALRLLQEAQDILLEKPRQFDVARYKVSQVSGIVNRRLNTSRWANTYGWAAFAYEVLWLGILVLAVFLSPVVVNRIVGIAEGTPGMDPMALSVLWNTMAWGGIGGVIGAFYSLYWHAALKKDFDKQYIMWYIVQPVIGLLIGGLVHLLIGAGFLTVMSKVSTTSDVILSALPYAVACIAGFRQRFILEIIDRVIQLLTPASGEAGKLAKDAKSDKASSTAAR